jgi:hypothetical protein
MQEKALEMASRITHPVTVAAFALVFAAFAFGLALKARKPRIAYVLALAIVLLGLAPLLASTFLQSKGVYRIRVVVLGLDSQPVQDAELLTSIGTQIKRAEGNSELELTPQTLPPDRKLTVFASKRDAFLAGSATLTLSDNYYQTLSIPLKPLPHMTVRGIVTDAYGRSQAGVRVTVPGYSNVAVTDASGNFELPAHAPYGQVVRVHAEKGSYLADMSTPAGNGQIELRLHLP